MVGLLKLSCSCTSSLFVQFLFIMNTPFSNTSFSFKNTRRSPFNLLFLIDPYLGIHPDELTEPNHDGKRDMDINPLAEVEKLKTKENSKFYSETSSLPLLPPPSLSAFLTHQNLTSNSQFIPLFRQFLEHFLTYVHSHYRHLVQW
ncbi:hypothetical protein HMI55_006962 [Coelomomyces lativittatus]|nr:hypothetical protein HMI55_006962 [Coelomomyces lativittatus]